MATAELQAIDGGAGGHPGHPGTLRRLARVLSALAAVVVAVVAALAVVVAVASHLGPGGQYVVFGHPVLSVLSGSMSPAIQTGDLVIDRPVTGARARHLRAGQVISFRAAPGSPVLITHRIVAREIVGGAVEYLTKGDANAAADTVLRPAANVIGVVQGSVRGGGYVLAALHRPLVAGLLIASVVLFFLAGPLFRLARRLDERDGGAEATAGEAGGMPWQPGY